MATIDDLKEWFERDVKFATWEENVRVEASAAETVVRLYTDINEYVLTISPQGEGALLDCAVRSRKARAGLAEPRFRPLWNGQRRQLAEWSWRRLLGAIVGLELVRVHRPAAAERGGERAQPPRSAYGHAVNPAAE
jgi:hypothetical protein